MINRRTCFALLATLGAVFAFVPAASAATLSVDDDGAQCPAASYSHIQDAIDAASPGDTIIVCDGTYVEGSGAPGTNALSINKQIDIKGAGADVVKIQPRRSTPYSGQIASGSPVLRDNAGNIISIVGGSAFPISVNISGVTVDGNGVYAEVGVMYLDAYGSFKRGRVTNIVTSEASNADSIPGGYRSNSSGWGIVQTTAAVSTPPGASTPRPLTIFSTRIDRYNKGGILIDGASNDTPPLNSIGINNQATITQTEVVGRLRCTNFLTNGNCSNPATLTSGPLFGQDGVRVTAGSKLTMNQSIVTSNQVLGSGAPTVGSATNNANLPLGGGIRLLGANVAASTITESNIVDNAYGLQNLLLDGTVNTVTRATAENNWWGLRETGLSTNSGPAISPTTNPPLYENPVNGVSGVVDATCVTHTFSAQGTQTFGVTTNSTAVDFCPFRNGAQADPDGGEFSNLFVPQPMSDAGPSVTLSIDAPSRSGQTDFERGQTARLTADASDDFGLKSLTFYDGATQIGTATPPAQSFDYVIPLNAACADRTLTVVATDSSGQTATDSKDITVIDPEFDCTGPPTIALTAPGTIAQGGSLATAAASGPAGVQQVDFYLGARHLCTDTTPTYSCNVLANGNEVGSQVLRAVVTDNASRTEEDTQNVTVPKFQGTLTLNTKKLSKKKRQVSGTVDLPARVSAAQGCSGTVALTVKRGNSLITSLQLPVSSSCTFTTNISLSKKAKKNSLTASASFGGNGVLLPASNNRRFS